MQNKPNLLHTQMNVSSALTKHYENNRLPTRPKNKPNQTQSKSQCQSQSRPYLIPSVPLAPLLNEVPIYRERRRGSPVPMLSEAKSRRAGVLRRYYRKSPPILTPPRPTELKHLKGNGNMYLFPEPRKKTQHFNSLFRNFRNLMQKNARKRKKTRPFQTVFSYPNPPHLTNPPSRPKEIPSHTQRQEPSRPEPHASKSLISR